ncbi:hypothetical protein ACFYW6_37815 [Streptomyces sp. NPDC002659]|uniref:hypothetical protein n=1 Tax=Streptomyces sp. NPDC002659 TaxID=3364656 RepID=UPI00368A3C8A
MIGAVGTNGRAGTIRYRWRRSDGTVSGILREQVASGTRHTDVVLRWAFHGSGTLQATATLELLSPVQKTAHAMFRYVCH